MNTSRACNLSCNTTYASFDVPFSKTESALIVLAMALIFFMALVGNAVVITVISRVSSMHTPTNLLLLNLSVADIFVAVFFILFSTITMYISQHWIFGAFLCKVVPFIQLTAARVSILSLAVISVERYLTVCKPKDWRLSVRHIRRIIAVLWLVGMVSATPMLVVKDVSEFNGKTYCLETGWTFDEEKFYTTIIFVILYLVPITLMSVAYFNIGIKVWSSAKTTSSQRRYASIAKQKTTKMCLALVISFVVSWTPVYVVTLERSWGTSIYDLSSNTRHLLFALTTGFSCVKLRHKSRAVLFYEPQVQERFRSGIQRACDGIAAVTWLQKEEKEEIPMKAMKTFNKTSTSQKASFLENACKTEDTKRFSQQTIISLVSSV